MLSRQAWRSHSASLEPQLNATAQACHRWEAILLVLDGQPFEALAGIVQALGDERVWTFAEWIGLAFAPRTGGDWTPGMSLCRMQCTSIPTPLALLTSAV